jgi:hypothetical protein
MMMGVRGERYTPWGWFCALSTPLLISFVVAMAFEPILRFFDYKLETPLSPEIIKALFDAQFGIGRDAINRGFIMHGGAIIAILTFVGSMISSNSVREEKLVAMINLTVPAITCFALGLVFTVLLSTSWYFDLLKTVRNYGNPMLWWLEFFSLWSSMLYFVAGVLLASFAFYRAATLAVKPAS